MKKLVDKLKSLKDSQKFAKVREGAKQAWDYASKKELSGTEIVAWAVPLLTIVVWALDAVYDLSTILN